MQHLLALYGYGIMNEPHDMGGAGIWKSAAQAAVSAILITTSATLADAVPGALAWFSLREIVADEVGHADPQRVAAVRLQHE